jgi:hypothetical protein
MNYLQKCLKSNYTDDRCIYYDVKSYFPKIKFEAELIFSDDSNSSSKTVFVKDFDNLTFCQAN